MYDFLDEKNLYAESFGLWITGLFGNIPAFCRKDIGIAEHKAIFFYLLDKWLREGRIVFCSPDAPLEEVWDDNPSNIVSYLKDRWPESVKDRDDIELTVYLHEIPAILWVGDNGVLVGS
ncbi:hypothetical protein CBP51_04545 [Cellvibrio mixtus]|uniref:DUF596 domain-containing protein n=1 Tax=Cellvibrio mixtus TaxID=39650 RepID=A0A266QAB3_9GAMM|nr:hypothetical protein [Cellvibrio mixtus]OZY86301.1 hypothetical protein CBP51_04545 [Cellvibrio mixtus]